MINLKKILTNILILTTSLIIGIQIGKQPIKIDSNELNTTTYECEQENSNNNIYDLIRSNLPKQYRDNCNKIKIEVVKGELETKYKNMKSEDNILGFYSYKDNKIVLETNDTNISNTLKHELGHYIDGGNNKYSFSNDFLHCYMKDRDNLFFNDNQKYWHDNIREYFAECYAMFNNKEAAKILKVKAPLTYNYMQRIWSGEI